MIQTVSVQMSVDVRYVAAVTHLHLLARGCRPSHLGIRTRGLLLGKGLVVLECRHPCLQVLDGLLRCVAFLWHRPRPVRSLQPASQPLDRALSDRASQIQLRHILQTSHMQEPPEHERNQECRRL